MYRGVLYVVSTNGVLTAFEVKTGKQFYQKRIPPGGVRRRRFCVKVEVP
jgi:hypothetical protein